MADTLHNVLSSPNAPPFIYLHHPHHPTTSAVPAFPSRCLVAHVDAIEHHNPRLLYSGVINKLAPSDEEGEINTWDGFARRLREFGRKGNGKRQVDGEERQVVVVITKAEKLRTVLGGGWAVITRLAELTGVAATVVLASAAPWDEVRPPRGDALEPVHVYLPPISRDELLRSLMPGSGHPLYPRFLELLLATFSNLIPTSLPAELDYLAESLWPIYTASLPPHREQDLLARPYPDPEHPPAPLSITVKLLTDLKHQLSLPLAAAMENVLPRLTGRAEFTETMLRARAVPKPPGLELPVPQRLLGPKPFPLDRLLALFASLFAEHAERPEDLQAASGDFCSDSEEEDGWLPSAAQAQAKAERRRTRDTERDERWEDEVKHLTMSVKLWSLIPELEAQGLLRRVSPPDRLDNVMLRCEIDCETAKKLANDLRITLDEYIYEATS